MQSFVLLTEIGDIFNGVSLYFYLKNNKWLLFLPEYLVGIFSNINKMSIILQAKALIIFVDLIKLGFWG